MEFLKQHLSTELYQQLADALKSNDKVKLANLAEGEYVSKRKYDDELQKSIDLTAKITERDTQIAELGKTVGLTDEFKKQIKELQDANKQTEIDWQNKLQKQAYDFALDTELKNTYKARDIVSVLPHLKADAIKFADGAFIGLTEQMTELVKNKPFLFGDDTPSGTGSPVNPLTPDGGGAWDFGYTAVNKPIINNNN